jgi:hypothetical protein
MEILDRKENSALDRVELKFQWDHSKEATPSLSQMADYVIERHNSRGNHASEENNPSMEEESQPGESDGQPEESEEGDA